MSCPHEFTWAMYADGELPESEAWKLRTHLAGCVDCRRLAAHLQEENRALVHAFQELDLTAAASRNAVGAPAKSRLIALAAVVFSLAAVVRLGLDYMTGQEIPVSFQWLNPFHPEGQLNLFVTSIVYLFDEGGATVISLLNSLALLGVIVFILMNAPRRLRRSTSSGVLLTAILVILCSSIPTYAIERRAGGRNAESIVVASGETIDDTLLAAGEAIIIEGTINGDLIAAGRNVFVRGTVEGNVIAFAQSIEVDGTVKGTIYGFAQHVRIRGQAARDVYGFGQNVTMEKQGQIAKNLVAFGQAVTIDGNPGRDVKAFAQKVDVRGVIGRDLSANAAQVTLFAPARVERDLVAEVRSNDGLKVESGATVGGKTDLRVVPPRPSQYATLWFYVRQILWLIAAFITGLILFWLLPALSRPTLDAPGDFLRAGVIGFLAAVATPVAAIIIGITIIGLPIALASFALWLLGLYLAKIVVAAFIGRALFPGESSLPMLLFVGLLLVLIAVDLPYIGGLVNILLTFIGLGAAVYEVYRYTSRPRATPSFT